jgi:predicted component of type VI protein secretion system
MLPGSGVCEGFNQSEAEHARMDRLPTAFPHHRYLHPQTIHDRLSWQRTATPYLDRSVHTVVLVASDHVPLNRAFRDTFTYLLLSQAHLLSHLATSKPPLLASTCSFAIENAAIFVSIAIVDLPHTVSARPAGDLEPPPLPR